MVKNYILCMACFCSEDSRGDDRRPKFSLVYEIRASKATVMTSLPSPSLGSTLYFTLQINLRKFLEQPNLCENLSLTKFRTHVEWNVSNTLKKELCDSAL